MTSDNETCSVCDAPLRSVPWMGGDKHVFWVCTVCTETVIDGDYGEVELPAIRLTRKQRDRFLELMTEVGVFKEKTVIEFNPGQAKGESE